jgi:hypothetical protein
VIGDAPCELEEEREVGEGCGLGEEELERWCTEGREEGGGGGQISTTDGAPVLGRATGTLAREGGAWLRCVGRGREGMGRNGDETTVDGILKTIGSVVRAERGKKGGWRGHVRVEAREGGEGGGG